MENIETGLLLMGVGMTTVFAILLIVINLGKGLILLVNRYAPEEATAKRSIATPVRKQASAQTSVGPSIASPSNLETAVIVSAVSAVTRGQGHVIKIEKI